MFEKICPGEEFLPKAPNPEDIIYDDGENNCPKESGFEPIPEEDAAIRNDEGMREEAGTETGTEMSSEASTEGAAVMSQLETEVRAACIMETSES